MFVPARRSNARTVAAGARQVAVRPRHPRCLHFEFWQAFQQCRISADFGRRLQAAQVPRTADHRNALVAFFDGVADALAHVGFAQQLAAGAVGALLFALRTQVAAQRGHGLGDGSEQLFAIAALFDGVVPPAFAIGVAGGLRQPVQRVSAVTGFDGFGRCRFSVFCGRGFCSNSLLFALFGQRQLVGQRQVDKRCRHLPLQRPAQRLPFGRKHRKRVVDRTARVVGAVTQQGDGRLHLFGQQRGEHSFAFGRAFDQHAVGLQGIQSPHQAARTARSVVADAEIVDFAHSNRLLFEFLAGAVQTFPVFALFDDDV